MVGVLSAFLHGIGQFDHLKAALSIYIYIYTGFALFVFFRSAGIALEDVVFYSFLAVTLNSLIILMQVMNPSFRTVLESFLIESGNIDWTEGFRYRGIASGGGASLSVLTSVAMAMGLHLYKSKYIGVVTLVCCSAICIVALFFIGRTGVLLLPVAFVLLLWSPNLKSIVRMVGVVAILLMSFVAFQDELKTFLTDQYGDGFYRYSLGYFLEGLDGLEKEGTASTIVDYLKVVPTTFPEILFGYGFYGGSYFHPWTDSGYSRMFLSVGYIFGVAFYIVIGLIACKPLRYRPYLFSAIIMILLVAEAKEPMLTSGYAARLLFVLIGFAIMEARYREKKHYTPLQLAI